jgi:hypothetical protein
VDRRRLSDVLENPGAWLALLLAEWIVIGAVVALLVPDTSARWAGFAVWGILVLIVTIANYRLRRWLFKS